MKKNRTIVLVVVAALVLGVGESTFAAGAKDRLIDELYAERDTRMEALVNGFRSDTSGDGLYGLAKSLLDTHIRLKSFDPPAGRDKVAKIISGADLSKIKSRSDLAGAIAISYYRAHGLRVNVRRLFDGRVYSMPVQRD